MYFASIIWQNGTVGNYDIYDCHIFFTHPFCINNNLLSKLQDAKSLKNPLLRTIVQVIYDSVKPKDNTETSDIMPWCTINKYVQYKS